MSVNEMLSIMNLPEIVAELDERNPLLHSRIPDKREDRGSKNKPNEGKKSDDL